LTFIRRHLKLLVGLGLVGIALVVFVLVWFQPQKLVIEKRVNQAAPTQPPPPMITDSKGRLVLGHGDATQFEGTFKSREHETSGVAKAIPLRDGRAVLRLENFRTSNGPDVVVYLSKQEASTAGVDLVRDFVDLGPLKGNIGDQNYAIPDGTSLDRYRTVVIWCRRFNVAFGVAALEG
jgi:electron transfer DM13